MINNSNDVMLDELSIQQALNDLKAGKPVAIPTETVYGLAAPISNDTGLRKIFELKDRPFFDPLIVHISSMEQLSEISPLYKNEILRGITSTLMNHFWPGPLTFVLPKHNNINPIITSGLETVGVRMPSHPVAREIIKRLGIPLAAPSANKFGKTSPTKLGHVRETWREDELLVLDGGQSEIGIESTVIRLALRDEKTVTLEILRKGHITADDFRAVIGDAVEITYLESSASPGHTPHHYMPETPLVIVRADFNYFSDKELTQIEALIKKKNQSWIKLPLDSDPRIAARNLYDDLRTCSKQNKDIIIVSDEFLPESPNQRAKWLAIWDRIERASSLDLRNF